MLTRASRLPRPRRIGRAVAAFSVAVGGMLAAARASGSQTAQTAALLLGAVSVVFLASGAFQAYRLRVTYLRHPTDVVAGATFEVRLRCYPACEATLSGMTSTKAQAGATEATTIVVRPDKRGVIRDLVLELSTASPFGLLWWSRRVRVPLPEPIYVYPRPGPVDHALCEEKAGQSEGIGPPGRAHFGEIRGVREYVAGDELRSVHWKLSAHTSTLLTKEYEYSRPPTYVVRALPRTGEDLELLLSKSYSTALDLMRQGASVALLVREGHSTAARLVADPRDLGRALAMAQ
jgi:uncharacterized protein (DUF58 family)